MDDAQLQTAWQNRQGTSRTCPLGAPLSTFLKRTLAPRVRQVGKIAAAWERLVPEAIASHTCLESFSRGTLTVLVDTAAHRFQLQTLLRNGLQKHLQQEAAVPLNRVKLVPGQFYSLDANNQHRYQF